jgi:mannan polymerase II complex MNN10 subunit
MTTPQNDESRGLPIGPLPLCHPHAPCLRVHSLIIPLLVYAYQSLLVAMMPTSNNYRFPVPGTLLPKILVGILAILIFCQLWSYSAPSAVTGDTTAVAPALHDGSRPGWYEDTTLPITPTQGDGSDAGTIRRPHSDATTPSPDATSSSPSSDAKVEFRDYKRTFISYGTTQCLPSFDDNMKAEVIERNASCTKHAPFLTQEIRRVALATITTGKTTDAYQRAIVSQMFASAVHGTSTHVLCEQLSDGVWNKIAFLLNLVMTEMLKPADERLEWIMWIDRDAIILDSCRPLSSFLPPNTTEFQDVNMITNHDGTGLNAGVFIFKVGDWATDLFNTILAFRYYRPDEELALAEQTAMEKITREDKWKNSVVRVPWYWFNAYPDEDDSVRKYENGVESEDLEWFRARKGDFVVHFAGDDGRSGRMPEWLDMLQRVGNVYEKSEQQRDVTPEVRKYWSSWLSKSLTPKQMSGEKWKEENASNRTKNMGER